MKKLVITLEITDSEVVDEYSKYHKDFIFDDLQQGDLIDFCEIVKVEVKNG